MNCLRVEKPLLSIIVPIYNVEQYLERCIISILNQSFDDFELILVNDGSPDASNIIMQDYSRRDSRIINLYQENKGVSAARNLGLRHAKGKYIAFVDPDDWIDQFSYEKLLKNMCDDVVLSCSNWDTFDDKGTFLKHMNTELPEVMELYDFVFHYFDIPRPMGGNVNHKLFIRSRIKHYFDETLTIGEDYLFLLQYLSSIERGKVFYCDESLYHIYTRSDSATRKDENRVALVLAAKKKGLVIASCWDRVLFNHALAEYLDTAYSYANRPINCSEYIVFARKEFFSYLNSNTFQVMLNTQIYWKTRILYIKLYLKLCLQGVDY